MSSCLCESVEGAIFPLWVHEIEDRINDSIHALHVDKADHGPGAAADLHEAALDDVGGAQLPPQVSRELEKLSSSGRSLSSWRTRAG